MSRVATSANATRDANDLVLGERRPLRLPIGLGDDELHGFEPLLPLSIVAIAHADETVAVLGEQLLSASCPGLRCSPTRGTGDARDRGDGVVRKEGRGGADQPQRPSDGTGYVSGRSLRALVMSSVACSGEG